MSGRSEGGVALGLGACGETELNSGYPGVAQLVARVVWDHQAAGSNPVTRTRYCIKTAISGGFYAFIVMICSDFQTAILRKTSEFRPCEKRKSSGSSRRKTAAIPNPSQMRSKTANLGRNLPCRSTFILCFPAFSVIINERWALRLTTASRVEYPCGWFLLQVISITGNRVHMLIMEGLYEIIDISMEQ